MQSSQWNPADPSSLLATALELFRKRYAAYEPAQAYLASRGLGVPGLADHFQIGFADRSLASQLPPSSQVGGRRVRKALAELGIMRPTGHGHFNGSIVVPIHDASGRVIEIYGRKIGKGLKGASPLHTWLNDPPRGTFNLASLQLTSTAIVCGSIMDALSFWAAGHRNAITHLDPPSTLASVLATHDIRQAFIALRRDSAEDTAAQDLADMLIEAGIDAYRIQLPLGKDANDFLRTQDSPEMALGQLLRGAEWLGKGERDHPPLSALPPLPAQPAEEEPPEPEAPQESPAPPDQIILERSGRRYRVRGLAGNLSYSALRVNVMVSSDQAFHVDTLDLYSSKLRASFIKLAAGELHASQDIIKADIGAVIMLLEEIQDSRLRELTDGSQPEPIKLTEEERSEAIDLLRDPALIDRIQADLETSGVVGEDINRLIAYLAATSRKLERPLAVVIQSSSSSGKSALMNGVLELMPPEEMIKFSAMTAQSLYYLGEQDLKHRILAIAEEEGAERASYALKLLQSEGELRIASPAKDGTTGRIRTQEYRVEGPVMLMMTTTATDVDEELLNRCMVLAVDEGREQTRAIQQLQREAQTLYGLLSQRDRGRVQTLHRNAQRLLKPVHVVNPYAEQLTFLDDRTRTRRDHLKYLTLIRAIALLHQYQRPTRSVQHQGEQIEYIEVAESDIALANHLARQVMLRSLDDMAPQTQRLLSRLSDLERERREAGLPHHFSRRDVMHFTGWTYKQVRTHLGRLTELEYVSARKDGGRLVYEVLADAAQHQAKQPTVQLIDPEGLTPRRTQRTDTASPAPPCPGVALDPGQAQSPAPQADRATLPSCPPSSTADAE